MMPDLNILLARFTADTTDGEIINALDNFIVDCGLSARTSRLQIMEVASEKKRCFVIVFTHPNDSYQFAAKYHVPTFAYDSVQILVPISQ